MANIWYRGHLSRFWSSDDYKNLPYIRQPITDEEIENWKSMGYDYVKSFTGTMYDSRNPMPKFVDTIKEVLGDFKNHTFTFYKMETLEIMPVHQDHYKTYMNLYDAVYHDVCRILLMLEDWKPGHYLEIDGKGITNWIAGDYFVWEGGCPHAAANIGVDPRYTLQITATKLRRFDLAANEHFPEFWANLHWFNIPGLETKEISQGAFLKNRMLPALNIPKGHPFYLYMYNSRLADLDVLNHNEEESKILNEKGVDIYLYEPLCSYTEGSLPKNPGETRHSMQFYSEFKGDEDINSYRAEELDSIYDYAVRNNIEKIKVHTCDYNVDQFYSFYNDRLELIFDDIFVKTAQFVQVKDPTLSPDFQKKFITLNWRWTAHRHMIAGYLAGHSSYVSFYFRSDLSNIGRGPWYDLFKFPTHYFKRLIEGLSYINQECPLNVDLNLTLDQCVDITDTYCREPNPGKQITIDQLVDVTKPNPVEKFYRDVFCDVVTESRFAQPTGNYSEKVHLPMFYKKPFILCAPPKTLELLRKQGYKTFGDFWDESYDDCFDHEQRLFKIFEVIDFIESKSLEELQQMYLSMEEILVHNFNQLKIKIALTELNGTP